MRDSLLIMALHCKLTFVSDFKEFICSMLVSISTVK